MQLRVDGKEFSADVDLRTSTIQWGESTFPIKIISGTGGKVEVEIAGETAIVDGWPEGLTLPLESIAVNGERVTVEMLTVERSSAAGSLPSVRAAPSTTSERPAAAVRSPVDSAGGIPVVPPMPGRVIEIRVKEGQRVRQGEVLVILEAMKMRNEIQSPADGTVVGITVKAGENSPARQPLLFVRPSSSA